MKRFLVGVAAAVLGSVVMGLSGLNTAAAADPPTSVTLPLFGAPLTFEITTGPGGAITEVAVDPADNTVATKLKPHKVVFKSAPADPLNTADPARVEIKSKHGGQSISAKAGSLADVSGPGIWSGDIFGVPTTVNFTIGATATGGPDIVGTTVAGAAGVIGPVKYSSEDDDDEVEQSARVSIKFTNADGDQSRTLTIKVKVEEEDEDGVTETEAKLSISLSRIKGLAVPAADAVGLHTWNGVLCDNTPASIAYMVALDGTVSDVVATPGTPDVRSDEGKIKVSFSDHERVQIHVKEDDGMIKISVKERIRCDSPDPTTNVDTSLPPPDDDDDDHDGDQQKDHDDDGDHGGDGGSGSDFKHRD